MTPSWVMDDSSSQLFDDGLSQKTIIHRVEYIVVTIFHPYYIIHSLGYSILFAGYGIGDEGRFEVDAARVQEAGHWQDWEYAGANKGILTCIDGRRNLKSTRSASRKYFGNLYKLNGKQLSCFRGLISCHPMGFRYCFDNIVLAIIPYSFESANVTIISHNRL